jgi:heat shock protein HtpX
MSTGAIPESPKHAAPGGNLFAQQEANRMASRRLVAGFIIFIAWLGFGGDIIWYLATRDAAGPGTLTGVHIFPGLGLLLTIFAGGMAWWGYNFGATSLIKATGAREITSAETDQERQLVNVVDEMAIASGSKRPHIWIVPDAAPNAFATGVQSEDAHLAVTQGLLDTLNREQLQAVVGHEMGHIVNLDVRLMTLLTALVGIVALVHNNAFRVMRFGGSGGRGRSRSSSKGGGMGVLVVVLLVVWIVSWLIAPLVTRYMAMKVGRSREFLADTMSAQFTRNPGALAQALEKISRSTIQPTMIPKSSAQLCIADPYHSAWGDREGRFADLMATHPPLAERVRRLHEMAYQNAGTSDNLQSPLSMSEA